MARQRREVGFPGRVHRVVRFEIATDPVEHLATACLGTWLDAVVEEHQARTAGRGFLQRLRSILLERIMAIATGAEHEDRVCLVDERGIGRPSLEAGGHRQAWNGFQSLLQQVDARVVLVLQRSVTGLVGDREGFACCPRSRHRSMAVSGRGPQRRRRRCRRFAPRACITAVTFRSTLP